MAGLSAEQKLGFLGATFALPAPGAQAAEWARWRSDMLPPVPGLRVDRKQLSRPGQLEGKHVAGFKLRPYPLAGISGAGSAIVDNKAAVLDSLVSAAEPALVGEGCEAGSLAACIDGEEGITSSSTSGDDSAGSNGSSNGSSSSSNCSSSGRSSSRGHTAMSGLDPAAVNALLHRHNVSVLLTLRRNALKEALSWYKARELGVSQFTARRDGRAAVGGSSKAASDSHVTAYRAEAREAAASGGQVAGSGSREGDAAALAAGAGKLHVDVPALIRWLNYTDRVNGQLRQAAAYFGRPTLTLWYEDFQADPVGTAQRAAAFIGVPGGSSGGLRLSGKFQKAGPDAVEDWVANHEASGCAHARA